MRPDAIYDLSFLFFFFYYLVKLVLLLSSFTLIKSLFSSSLLSAITVLGNTEDRKLLILVLQ